MHTLKQEGHLYENSNQEGLGWHGETQTHKMETVEKNEFLTDLQLLDAGKMEAKVMEAKIYELDRRVNVWSDFLRLHLHPNSLLTLPGIFHNDSSFQSYPAGHTLWGNKALKESFEERLHFFVEECDSLQGFQLLVDVDDGFGGLGGCLAQELADEFSQKGVLAVTLSPMTRPLDKTSNFHATMLNQAMCLDDLCTYSSLVCPMSILANPWRSHTHSCFREFPSVKYEHTFPYHSAALLAAALETASLTYRAHHPVLSLPSMADALTTGGRKVCAMGMSLPFSLPPDTSLLKELDHTPLHSQLQPLTPFCSSENQCWSQCISMRGIPTTYPLCSPKDPRYTSCGRHVAMALSSHLSEHYPTSSVATHLSVIRTPLSTGNPFPTILPGQCSHTREVPCCASFQSVSGVGEMVSALSSELQRLDVRTVPSFASTCLDGDSYMELKHRLVSLGKCYATKPDLDDTSDSD